MLISLIQDKEKWSEHINEFEVSSVEIQKVAAKALIHYAFPGI